MKKIALLDIGNTRVKLYFVNQGKIELVRSVSIHLEDQLNELEEVLRQSNSYALGTSVRPELNTRFSARFLSIKDIPSNKINYGTPATLGLDRILACFGAYRQSQKSVIVVDAGSAITVDLMTGQGVFQGGFIVPGLQAVQTGVQLKTPKLPTINWNIKKDFIPTSSKEAVSLGASTLFKGGISSMILQLQSVDKDAELWITGGDAAMIQQLLTGVQFQFDPYLVLKGILEAMNEGWLT